MGLDVTAYKKLTKWAGPCDEDGEPIDLERDYVRLYPSSDFVSRADGLEKGIYTYEDALDGFSGGYGGYNFWREELARLAGYEAIPYTRYGTTEMRHDAAVWNGATGPFSELINFTDCDGLIGPVTAAKLAKDFAEFDERAKTFESEGRRNFYECYCEFRASMDFAADGGAVQFH
jgi:hypothetical protein